jgi:hypothetical protein
MDLVSLRVNPLRYGNEPTMEAFPPPVLRRRMAARKSSLNAAAGKPGRGPRPTGAYAIRRVS